MNMFNNYQADVVIIGGGLAGIATAAELLDYGKKVIILERSGKDDFGGMAKDAFGGITFVNTPEQRRLRISDSPDLLFEDWKSFAGFSEDDIWPRKWAQIYAHRSYEKVYLWLKDRAVKFMPIIQWPERGTFTPGNSVPRWHIVWGTGHWMMKNIISHLDHHPKRNNLKVFYEHQVNRLETIDNAVTECFGVTEKNGEEFRARGDAFVVSCGGICGGDLTKARENWFKPWGDPPKVLLNGGHRYADGLLHDAVSKINGNITYLDRQFHYSSGIYDPNPDIPMRGLSVIPPRSALWMNREGRRIGPVPLVSCTGQRYLVEQICKQPGQFSWQIFNRKIAIKELSISCIRYLTTFRNKSKRNLIRQLFFGNSELIDRLLEESHDFVSARSIGELAQKMNKIQDSNSINPEVLEAEIRRYDDQIERGKHNDFQLRWIADFRKNRADRLRTCNFQKINDPKAMPLIAVRYHILTRKTLGGIQTDLQCRVLDKSGNPINGLYAAGESAGFGGGGIHGMNSLEGTFLSSCILTGRMTGMAISGKSELI